MRCSQTGDARVGRLLVRDAIPGGDERPDPRLDPSKRRRRAHASSVAIVGDQVHRRQPGKVVVDERDLDGASPSVRGRGSVRSRLDLGRQLGDRALPVDGTEDRQEPATASIRDQHEHVLERARLRLTGSIATTGDRLAGRLGGGSPHHVTSIPRLGTGFALGRGVSTPGLRWLVGGLGRRRLGPLGVVIAHHLLRDGRRAWASCGEFEAIYVLRLRAGSTAVRAGSSPGPAGGAHRSVAGGDPIVFAASRLVARRSRSETEFVEISRISARSSSWTARGTSK